MVLPTGSVAGPIKILIIDGNRDLVALLGVALDSAGFRVLAAHDWRTGLKLTEETSPDLVVLDVNLPDPVDGFQVLQGLQQGKPVPVIILSALSGEDDKVIGLELGADDYLTKPFSHRELIARIRAVLRRSGRGGGVPESGVLQVGPLRLDPAGYGATKTGEALHLTVTEFRLLRYLMLNAGTLVPLRSIVNHIWGYDEKNLEVARVVLYRLRRKVEADPTIRS